MKVFASFLCYLVVVLSATARADIYRWDNSQLIPGTEGITPGPGVVLDHHELAFAALSGRDLTGARFDFSNLTSASLGYSTLTNANLTGAVVTAAVFGETTSRGFTQAQLASTASYQKKDLQGIELWSNDLTGWNFSGQNIANAILDSSWLTNANLTGAVVTAAVFGETTSRGFKQAQLASTASYQTKNLQDIGLYDNDLTGWDFSGQDLTNAELFRSRLTNANLAGAVVTGASFWETTSRGFTQAQLASTASYQSKNLQGIQLSNNDLTGWDFSGQNLTNAYLGYSTLTNANLTGAVVMGASFAQTTSRGFTQAQLASTASYQTKNLQGIDLESNNLTGWDFSGQNLTNANLDYSTLTNAELTGAVVTGASFAQTTSRGFTQAQLASTASYQTKNLEGIELYNNDLTGWDFSGQNLSSARLNESTLTNADLTGAVVTGASFGETTGRGFTQAQFASTASYETKNLQDIGLYNNDLTGWDFSRQDLTNAHLGSSMLANANLAGANLINAFLNSSLNNANLTGANLTNAYLISSTLTNADLTGADTRGAQYLDLTGATYRNAILRDGAIAGLNLAAGEQLVVHDDDGGSYSASLYWLTPRLPIPINIQDHLVMSDGGSLQLLFDADAWDSVISFQPGIPVTLGGNLELSFAPDVDPASQIGRTFHIFDWTGVEPTGTFTMSSLHRWDVSQLYSTGNVTLVPEPATVLLAACAMAAVMVPRIRRRGSDNAETFRDLPDSAFGHNTETIMRSARLMLMLWFWVSCSATYGQGQVLNRTLQHDGLTRSYSIYVPPAYTGEEAWPLVLNMHFMGGNAVAKMARTGMNGLADTGNFLVAYPNATVNPQVNLSQWNDGTMYLNGPDDVGFINAMIDELEIGYHINSSRIYASGISSGGRMSYYLGSELSGRIAAIASVAGQHPANPTAPRPFPVLHFFGTADPSLPFNGGMGNQPPPLDTFQFPAVTEVIDAWRDSNNSVGDPIITQLPNLNTQDGSTVTMIQYIDGDHYETNSGDKRPAEVLFYRIEGGGHTWPSGMNHPEFLGNVNRDINATEEIWKFFSRHELPAAMPEPVPGDYNQNGEVDAADYVVWRNGVGTTYAQGDYDVWRAHFGQTAGSGAAGYPLGASAEPLSAAVPEPTTLLVFLVGALEAYCCRRKRR